MLRGGSDGAGDSGRYLDVEVEHETERQESMEEEDSANHGKRHLYRQGKKFEQFITF